MATGYPDLVAVFLKEQKPEISPDRLLLGPEHIRLLCHLHNTSARSGEDVRVELRLSKPKFEAMFSGLERARVVDGTSERFSVRPLGRTFAAHQIVAIEAKVSDWRAAIRQAVANTWFASHSYILLPVSRLSDAVENEASDYGIGVLTYGAGQTDVCVPAAARSIPASHGSWLMNEWALRAAAIPSAQ